MPILVVVESPGKTKKIQSFLGDEYLVVASKGHIRNLDPNDLGIDIENNYNPRFIDMPDKGDVIATLKKMARKCSKVIGASDADREGASISYHVFEVLNIPLEQRHRATFVEITKKAIQTAVDNTGILDMNGVYSQFARMILDKLIGYKISPLLWKEFKNYHLSAGRVQSVVVKLIADREEEISKFTSNSYFKLEADFLTNKKDLDDSTTVSRNKNKTNKTLMLKTECENEIKEKSEIESIYNYCSNDTAIFTISSIKKNNTKRNPPPPYTTSTLQQDASAKLGMSPDVCMKNAQKLYEAGLITYMRTDAVFIAEEAMKSIESVVKEKWGADYYRRVNYKSKSNCAQEAHEACRPTDMKKENILNVDGMTSSHNRLYQLIWKRTLACQMMPADVEIRTVKVKMDDIEGKLKKDKKNYSFVGKFEKVLFEGFLKALNLFKAPKKSSTKGDDGGEAGENVDAAAEEDEEEEDPNEAIPSSNDKNSAAIEKLFDSFKEGMPLYCKKMDSIQKHTKPPHSRYTEASLVKKMDELGIGRPATYASMVNKVQEEKRQYVEKKSLPAKKIKLASLKFTYPNTVEIKEIESKQEGDKNKLFPTSLGLMINEFLQKSFQDIINYEFTAAIETLLDEIAAGGKIWYKVVDSVYLKLVPIIDQLARTIAEANRNTKTIMESGDSTADTKNRRFIGNNPANNLPIYVLKTRFGYSICESNPDKTLSRYASLTTYRDSDVFTVEQALAMMVYPKNLGTYSGHDIIVKKAKNIYLMYNGKNYSIENYLKANKDKVLDMENISFDEGKCIIEYYLNSDKAKVENAKKDRVMNEDIVIKVGMYGPYIKYKNTENIALTKKMKENWESITLEECLTVVEKKSGGSCAKGGKGTSKGIAKGTTKPSRAKSAPNTSATSNVTSVAASNDNNIDSEPVKRAVRRKKNQVKEISLDNILNDTSDDTTDNTHDNTPNNTTDAIKEAKSKTRAKLATATSSSEPTPAKSVVKAKAKPKSTQKQ